MSLMEKKEIVSIRFQSKAFY